MFANLCTADSICCNHEEGDIPPAQTQLKLSVVDSGLNGQKILPPMCLSLSGRRRKQLKESRETGRGVTEDSKRNISGNYSDSYCDLSPPKHNHR